MIFYNFISNKKLKLRWSFILRFNPCFHPQPLSHPLYASEPGTGLDYQVPGEGHKVLLYGCNPTGPSGVETSIGMGLEVASKKIIHRIKVGAAGRPLLLGDEVVAH